MRLATAARAQAMSTTAGTLALTVPYAGHRADPGFLRPGTVLPCLVLVSLWGLGEKIFFKVRRDKAASFAMPLQKYR